MVSYSDLFLFGTLIIGVISLCYEIFHKKSKYKDFLFLHKKKHRQISKSNGVS